MGRLTLNVLLSFAQFEREVTAERIRDKIAASKKKGLWMGGLAPLGYDPHPDHTRRELVVNESESRTVVGLFELYLEHGCLNATAVAAEDAGLRSKCRIFASGRVQGGIAMSRGQIHRILTNPVYRGQIRHKDKTWPGTHPAIVGEDLWDAVQDKLRSASARRRGVKSGHLAVNGSAPLLGKFRDETGDLLTPTHTQRHWRRIRYYVSNRLISGRRDREGWRLPAPAFERAVATAIADHLQNRANRQAVLRDATMARSIDACKSAESLANRIRESGVVVIAPAIESGTLGQSRIGILLDAPSLAEHLGLSPDDLDPSLLSIDVPFTCRRRGVEVKIVAGERERIADPTMLRALRHAHDWAAKLRAGTPLREIARRADYSESYVARILPLATLSPKIQTSVVKGTQPVELTLETLVRARLPMDWSDQEKRFGFDT